MWQPGAVKLRGARAVGLPLGRIVDILAYRINSD